MEVVIVVAPEASQSMDAEIAEHELFHQSIQCCRVS